MRACPKSKFENENGSMNIMAYDEATEYPEVLAWEKEYADECDRLATIIASKHKHHWGRWYLDMSKPVSLITEPIRPRIGKRGNFRGDDYWIELKRVDTKFGERGSGYSWIKHMSGKNWIGEQGLKDMENAFNDLIKEGLIKD